MPRVQSTTGNQRLMFNVERLTINDERLTVLMF